MLLLNHSSPKNLYGVSTDEAFIVFAKQNPISLPDRVIIGKVFIVFLLDDVSVEVDLITKKYIGKIINKLIIISKLIEIIGWVFIY